jgi:cation diffusion facilitator family transporter
VPARAAPVVRGATHVPPPADSRASLPGGSGEFTAGEAKQARRLGLVLGLISVFFVAEFAGALMARSVVLQADALHLLMDVTALSTSLFAMRLAVRKPTPRFTFGLRRAEPVAAIFNAVLVLAATSHILREGFSELHDEHAPEANIMLVVSIAALIVNGVSAWLLHGAMHAHDGHHGHAHHGHGHAHHGHGHGHAHHGHGHGHGHAHHDHGHHDHGHHDHGHHDHGHHDHDHAQHAHGPQHDGHAPTAKGAGGRGHALNLRGAWLHLIGDVLGSVAALVAALVIRFGGPPSVDPIASFLVAAILTAGAVRLIRDASLVLLEAAPAHLPVNAIRTVLLAFPGVREVRELHIWTLGAGHDAVTAHVRVDGNDPNVGARLSSHLREQFEVRHVTVQVDVD